MQSVTTFIPKDPQTCWRVFTDASMLTLWVPGLRRAQVLAKERGLPSEIHFEFATSLVYTLIYEYDVDSREAKWQPKLGRRDGVSGFVRFDEFDTGTRMTYGLEHGDGRSQSDVELGDLERLVEAFVGWMREAR